MKGTRKMHAIETPEVDIIDDASNQLTSTGKLLVGTALFVALILTVFIIDFFSMSSNADLPTDAMGTCQVEYADTVTLPIAGNDNEQEAQNAEPVVKHTYSVTMPDGQKVEGYGVSGTYVPLDGEYKFTGVLREDGGYNITVDSSYIPTSPEDVHEASRDSYDPEKAFVTQVVSDFVWMPEDDSYLGGDTDNNGGTVNDGSNTAVDVPDTGNTGNDGNVNTGEPAAEVDEEELGMSVDEKLAVESPSPSNPMQTSLRVEDGTSRSHEGLASDSTSVNVFMDYRNLLANDVFTLVASVVNVRDGSPVKNLDGTDLIAARDFVSGEAVEDAPLADASKLDGYLDAFAAVSDIAAASGETGLPTRVEIEAMLNDAKARGGRVIADNRSFFEPIYSYAAGADLATGRNLPSLQSVADACERAYGQGMKANLCDGTFEMNVPLPSENVKGKTIAVKVDLLYHGNSVASMPSDIKDASCYVSYPSIEMEATIRGAHEAKAEPGTVVIDTVEYENLVPGVQYHLESTVLDQDTQSIVLDSKTAEKVKFMTEFVPEKSSGVINVIFPAFDSSSMMGRKAAVTERIFRCETNVTESNAQQGEEASAQNSNTTSSGILHSSQKGTLVAAHEDIDDPMSVIDFNQDISLAETGGEIGTISAMGETPRPYLLAAAVILSLAVIAAIRIRQRM